MIYSQHWGAHIINCVGIPIEVNRGSVNMKKFQLIILLIFHVSADEERLLSARASCYPLPRLKHNK